jgi:hypothetical protein
LRYSDNNAWGLTLTYSAGQFVGVGGWETAVSTNGTNWAVSFLPEPFGYFGVGGVLGNPSDMTYGNSVYVEVGSTNGVGNILTSTDGNTWTPRTTSPAPGGIIASVAYGALKFVAVGNNDGFEYTSSTGSTWTRRSIPGGNKISYANGLFVVPLNNKTNLVSVDGINWSLNATGLTNMIGKVTYDNGLFMAQCGISISRSCLATSTDGTNWIQYARPLPNFWNSSYDLPDPDVSLATDGTRLVAVGATGGDIQYNSFIYTSDVLVGVRMTNNPSSKIALSGLVGRNYQIQSADVLTAGSNNWRTNATMQLTNTPYVWTDTTATNPTRFYRGVLLP